MGCSMHCTLPLDYYDRLFLTGVGQACYIKAVGS